MEDIFKEKFLENSTCPLYINGVEHILYQMKKCICKVFSVDGMKSTGFFCKIPFPDKSHLLPVLITTQHSLHDLKKQNSIPISINEDNIVKSLTLNNMRKIYMNVELDTCIIELLPEDKIDDFLEIDDVLFMEKEMNLECIYKKKSVYVLHYIKGEKLAFNSGILRNIYESNISHLCSTSDGSAGAPIISLETFKVIGIHKGSKLHTNENLGTLIKYPISDFLKGNNGH